MVMDVSETSSLRGAVVVLGREVVEGIEYDVKEAEAGRSAKRQRLWRAAAEAKWRGTIMARRM
jgi:hypothetical protein